MYLLCTQFYKNFMLFCIQYNIGTMVHIYLVMHIAKFCPCPGLTIFVQFLCENTSPTKICMYVWQFYSGSRCNHVKKIMYLKYLLEDALLFNSQILERASIQDFQNFMYLVNIPRNHFFARLYLRRASNKGFTV